MKNLYQAVVFYSSTNLLNARNTHNNPIYASGNRANPFIACTVEILLGVTKQNDVGILIHKCISIPSLVLNTQSLQQEIAQLRGHVVIATFVEENQSAAVKKAWVVDLIALAQSGCILWH